MMLEPRVGGSTGVTPVVEALVVEAPVVEAPVVEAPVGWERIEVERALQLAAATLLDPEQLRVVARALLARLAT
jgi:hypothetical protein